MPSVKNYSGGPSSEEKALDQFAEMMIEKIQAINKDWSKPWFTEGALQWPKNLSGREYNGMNSFMLLMHSENEGYKIPRYGTFKAFESLSQSPRGEGEESSRVMINKGEASFPVLLTTFTVVEKDTREKINYDDYKQLADSDKQRYDVFPKLHVFRVFNVEQTNLREARPDLWAKIEKEYSAPKNDASEQFSFEPLEVMMRDNEWICPIQTKYQNDAYYSISQDKIVLPEKKQFKDGESFITTAFHEMAHSTGKEAVHNRFDEKKGWGTDKNFYAREELVAEMSAALVATKYGMTKNIKNDSISYLKSWLEALHESPSFIKTVLADVRKASGTIVENIDRVSQEIKNGEKRGLTDGQEQGQSLFTSESQEEEQEVDDVQQDTIEEEEHVSRGLRL